MGTGRYRLLGNLLAGVAILATIVAISFGLPAVDRALPADRPVAAGRPYQVGAGVTVVPPPAAVVDVTKTRPAADRGSALFVLDTVRYAIVVTPFDGSLDQAATRLRRKITDNRGYQVLGDSRSAATATGVPGRQGGYTAPGRTGRYAVFVAGGLAVDVTISGAGPTLRDALPKITVSVASLTFPGRA